MDSLATIQLVHEQQMVNRRMMGILVQWRELLHRKWKLKFQHAFREANMVADKLASLAVEMDPRIRVLHDQPAEVCDALQADTYGAVRPEDLRIAVKIPPL
ncbi:hypothetical protein GH714_012904 [Hevea brasiliensis]|uniref:RNase H type-1 domain-containing protein n=1 Tax=Hevea brasiliensis TaxID=3981 RepID=A0A6A6KKF1_HEVBR|nr:hypothetical protein GH714_012904 [Hevea brasiliensis]